MIQIFLLFKLHGLQRGERVQTDEKGLKYFRKKRTEVSVWVKFIDQSNGFLCETVIHLFFIRDSEKDQNSNNHITNFRTFTY